MQFLVDTDNHIEGRQQLADHVQAAVRAAVGHYAGALTHIDAHLGDVKGADKVTDKPGAADKKCLLEARVSGVKNVVVSHQAPTLHQAIDGAAQKLRHALDSALGKLHDQGRRAEGLGHQGAELLPVDLDGE